VHTPSTSLSRRELLRNGGLAISLGAVIAACGSDRGGPTSPGRLGVAPPPATLPPVEATPSDATLLRTAQSIEYTALAVYDEAAATGALTEAEMALVGRIVEDHTRHAGALAELIAAEGADEYACANSFLMERIVEPTLAALEGTDDLHRDLLNIAHAFESWAGASYQALVSALSKPELRKAAMAIGTEEVRHATVLARAINPDETFSPAFSGDPEENDAAGFPVPYAIPSVFGRVEGIDLVVGARDSDGQRYSVQLQTPAENTFVYEYMSC
jgi:rubrerythrin